MPQKIVPAQFENITDIVNQEQEILEYIANCTTEDEIIGLVETYGQKGNFYSAPEALKKREPEAIAKKNISMKGTARWGTLKGLEFFVIADAIERNYAYVEMIGEFGSHSPGEPFRTRPAGTPYDFKRFNPERAFKALFNIIFKAGIEIYGENFTPEICKDAYVQLCPFKMGEGYANRIPEWFKDSKENLPET